MRWNIPCAGCGLTVQVSQGQIGRPLRCPSCLARVAVTPPARQEEAPTPPAPRRGRLWLAGGLAAVLLVGVAISVAYATWPRARPEPGAHALLALRRDGLLVGPPKAFVGGLPEPAPLAAISNDPAPMTSMRLPVGDQPGVPTLAVVRKVPTHLAVALDPVTGLAVLTTRDGRLRVYDPTGWNEVRSRPLERPAYHLQIDAARRLLFAACTPASELRLNDLGERVQAGGDIHVYDLDAALDGATGQLEPNRRFPVGTQLASLTLSPGGRQLYFLAEDDHSCRLGRIDTTTWEVDTPHKLPWPRPGLLAMAPDGRALYALAGGRLFTVDTTRWAITDEVATSFTVQAMVADTRGRLYLGERGRGLQVKVIDVATRKLLARFTSGAETDGLPSLALAGDSGRLLVGTSAFASGRVWVLDISGPIDKPEVIGQAWSDRGRLLRGGLSATSDGRHLLTGTGHVFRLPS
ncbi:MAG: hypothetical protein U0797_23945 [Gemmataceae bacterium]